MAMATLTQSFYARRSGPMLFWRIGRLGGSMYLAKSATPRTEERAALKARRRARTARLWHEARTARYWQAMWEEQALITAYHRDGRA